MANASCNLSAHSVSPSLMRSNPCLSSAMQSLLGPSFPDGNHNYWKSTSCSASYQTTRSLQSSNTRTAWASPLSVSLLEYYGGAAGRYPTMPPHFRIAIFRGISCLLAQWTEPAETASHREWARSGEEILRPFSANAHLLSALDVEAEEVINTAFGANLPRLAAVKEKYDPANFFRVNHNIKPGLAPA